MASVHVAVVTSDRDVRLAAARAFDDAPAAWSVELYETPPEEADVVVFGPDVDAGGGLRFDPSDPSALIAGIEQRVASVHTRVTAVTGAGRGVGVTSVAAHLAAAMARDHATCLVDLDVGGMTALRLGIDADDHLTWRDALDGGRSLESCALPVASGFRVLLAPDSEDAGAAAWLLERARSAWERVVVDLPCGQPLSEVVEEADAGVLVVSPTISSAARAKRTLEASPRLPWAVVLNRLGPGGETITAELARLVGRPVALELACAPRLRDREDDGRLLTSPWTRWWRGIERLAGALER